MGPMEYVGRYGKVLFLVYENCFIKLLIKKTGSLYRCVLKGSVTIQIKILGTVVDLLLPLKAFTNIII